MRKLIMLAFLLLFGCNTFSKETEIKGNIFIIGDGTQNIKLESIEVSAIPENEIIAYLERIEPSLKSEKANLEQTYNLAKSEYEEAQRKLEATTSAADQSQPYIRTMRTTDRARMSDTTQLKEIAQGSTVTDPVAQKRQALEMASTHFRSYPTAASIFKDFPTASSKAISDADGNFTLKIPKIGRYALAAHATRTTPNKPEDYYWLIWVKVDEKQQRPVNLTNTNLMTSNAPDNIKKVYAMNF